ncbi:hypothetical protein [Chitinimonas taiwanensis]|jgi:hypothetical protein|uniref:hypothetical protein n=1 Tax=Chitinimonas taiwanensis TaxID=240412 RepID=UPI001622F751
MPYTPAPTPQPCPRCQGDTFRIPRNLLDRLISRFVLVHRYRCHSLRCGWEGRVRVSAPALRKASKSA